MAAYLRDAYLYLFDKTFSPRPGVEYEVRKEIRRRFIDALMAVPKDAPPGFLVHGGDDIVSDPEHSLVRNAGGHCATSW